MQNNPLVSIIIPTYNRAHLIGETLDSVLEQTYTNWECIVVDDGSTDDTEVVVMNYVEKDNRFQFHKRPEKYKLGGNGARNYGAEMSESNYLIFFDSDDLLIEAALWERMNFEKLSDFDLVINNTATFKSKIGDSELLWNIFNIQNSNIDLLKKFLNNDMPWQTNGVTWSKDFYKKTRGWNEELQAWQDWELHIRALLLNPRILHLNPNPDNYYRLEGSNSIKDNSKEIKYYKSVRFALKSVCKAFNENKTIKNKISLELNKLSIRILIKMPLQNSFVIFILMNFIMTNSMFCLNRLQYIKIFFIEFLGKSTKIKQNLIKSSYLKHQEHMRVSNSYLKYTIQDLKRF